MKINLKNILKRKNIKNVELAKMIDVGKQQITNYCSGLQTPPLSTLEKIANALNCEMAELLPLGDNFMHFYDENGEWQGIIKKPVILTQNSLQELASIDKGLEDIKAGRVFSEEEVEAEMEKILKRNKITLKNSLKYEQ